MEHDHNPPRSPPAERAAAHVIVLNGPSSSGKTTLGRTLQRTLGSHAVLLPIDLLWQAIHKDRPNDWSLFELLTGVLFESALAFWKRGSDVIVDTVFERRECADLCQDVLGRAAPILVGLHCNVTELERREAARGDRRRGLAARQASHVHSYAQYDLCLHTDRMTVDECVAQVVAILARATGP
ncbi:MAG: chloramphenicol phosphotransferase CPT family protein [Myxococcales bacterium]|nr:chloramphenicol phosphotransferase CPT family protein [Myxococcales bacterium]